MIATGCEASPQNFQTYQLPSGKQIKVNYVQKMYFNSGGNALLMHYETEIPIENEDALKKEIDEIWSVFQADVEKSGEKNGIIQAVHYERSGIVRRGKGHGYVFNKSDDGKWRLVEDKEKR